MLELEVTIATVLFTSDAWVCSFPFVLSEPEGFNRRVIYMGGPCRAHDRLLLADLRTQHLVLFFYIIGGSLFLDYSDYNITTHYRVYSRHFFDSQLSLLFLNQIFIKNCSKLMELPNFMCTILQLPKTYCPWLATYALSKPNAPLCTEMILLAEIQI